MESGTEIYKRVKELPMKQGRSKRMSDKTKKWIKAAAVRAVKQWTQTAVSLITVGNLITELDWVSIIGISATAGVVSMLTSVAGLPEVEEE